jgi:RNA polymerase sigma-70 factor, ECF subfamily
MGATKAEEDRAVRIARLWSKVQPIAEAMMAGAVVDFHDAEDLVAELAETVVRKFDDYDPTRPFAPWALGIGRKLILRYYEKHAGERRVYFDESTLRVIEKASLEVSDELSARLSALNQCLAAIRGKSRQVLEMRYRHDLKPDAVASALGMSRNAVWVMLHRARKALRDCIQAKLATSAGNRDD